MASSAVDFARSNQQRFLNELKDLLRIPSVSTLEEHKPDIQKAADYVANELRRIGMENVEVIPTKGHPLIYADWLHAAGKPTALCYAHYDVQPADPLDEWNTPPFEPTERNNNIYARGAVDDKGQLWMEVKALESLMQAGGGKLPINVKVIFEGEEEVGGESIAEYIVKQKAKLKADFALVCDTELFAPNLPDAVRRPARPGLHRNRSQRRQDRSALRHVRRRRPESFLRADRNHQQAERLQGQNPDSRLLQRRESSHQGRTQSLEASALQRRALPQDRSRIQGSHRRARLLGPLPHLGASHARSPRHARRLHRRRRQDRDPRQGGGQGLHAPRAQSGCGRCLQEVLRLREEADAQRHRDQNHGPQQGPGRVVGTDNPYIKAATEALHDTFKKDTVFIRSGGSIPIVTDFQDVLKIPSVMMGFGLPDDNLHAPNEKFHIPNFYRGIETICRFFEKLGEK